MSILPTVLCGMEGENKGRPLGRQFGELFFPQHAIERMTERKISAKTVVEILQNQEGEKVDGRCYYLSADDAVAVVTDSLSKTIITVIAGDQDDLIRGSKTCKKLMLKNPKLRAAERKQEKKRDLRKKTARNRKHALQCLETESCNE